MWETQTPAPPPIPAPPRPGRSRLLAVQLGLCALALAGTLAARMLGLPLYARLRVAYTAAVTATSEDWLGGQRRLARFTQEVTAAFGQAAAEVWAQIFGETQPAAPVNAPPAQQPAAFVATRAVRGKAAPAGSTLRSYLPSFPMAFPLPGGWAETSGYGWRIEPVSGQGQNFHKGADLAAAEGTPVLAAAAGVVRSAGKNASYGNWLRILHPGGDETLYAHLQYLFVHAGQGVALGQQLGTVGKTGHVTGPHLHFELLHEGVRYDPQAALQAAG